MGWWKLCGSSKNTGKYYRNTCSCQAQRPPHLFPHKKQYPLKPEVKEGLKPIKILQARLQQYVNREIPDVQAGFRKGRGTRDEIANIRWIIEKAKEFEKNIYFCFIDYAKTFDYVDHKKLCKILQEMGIPDHLTCLLRNLHADQEATVRTGHGTTYWFQIEKKSTSRLYIVTLLI